MNIPRSFFEKYNVDIRKDSGMFTRQMFPYCCVYPVGDEAAGCFAFLWFVRCELSVIVFLLSSLVDYVL